MGHLSLAGAVSALIIGFAASLAGGSVGGILVGGKALGNELAAMMGGFFGPLAGIAGTMIGLVVLALIG